ncbi:hypothetical protein EJB05_49391 [Eragrostis curvula]|uniref:Uncharacterized protein n=1 Tax=Eragrostis curvula TaxID=38414 RepID=A0A5J9T4E3_9POAL|nr:hypothetical protein EJB05_49391 [Eragrostis curvula]
MHRGLPGSGTTLSLAQSATITFSVDLNKFWKLEKIVSQSELSHTKGYTMRSAADQALDEPELGHGRSSSPEKGGGSPELAKWSPKILKKIPKRSTSHFSPV